VTTDTDVLEQACRNVRGGEWTGRSDEDFVEITYHRGMLHTVKIVRAEYHRLLKLKKAKKKWKP